MRLHDRSRSFLFITILLLGGCAAGGDVRKPIPTSFFAAAQPAKRLVVMLPGRGDDLSSLERKGMASIIQKAWPDADVILTGLTMPFYRQGQASKRLHDEIIAPAQQVASRKVWLMGISLGGMGAVLYEHDYPGQTEGLLLLSPYLGDQAIQDTVRNAGGLQSWDPGPFRPLNQDTFQAELWHTLKNLSNNPQRARSVWLAYGADEPFRTPIELMSPALPPGNVLMLPGRHDWSLWIPAASALLEKASTGRGSH
jgi:pimeloyl-ACP methyl ester carboxylesterase